MNAGSLDPPIVAPGDPPAPASAREATEVGVDAGGAPERLDHSGRAGTVGASLASPRPAADSDSDDIALELSRGDRRFLLVAGALLLALSAARWAQLSGFGLQEVEIERLPQRRHEFRLDINRAAWPEWMQLENIGEPTARRIVADRQERGPFRSIDDLARVPGIGPKTLARIRGQLVCSDCPAP